MTWIRIGIALAVLTLSAGAARADEGKSRAIGKGRWSLAFALPDGGGSQFGVWKMVSGRSNLGVNLGIDHSRDTFTIGPDSLRVGDVRQHWTFSVEPTLERYLFLEADVSPFVFGALKGSYGWSESTSQRSYLRSAALTFGLGADWTPLQSISIGGTTGIVWRESMYSYSGAGAPKDGESTFGTVSTSLQLHLYF